MATHSSVLSWRIPGTGEPGRLPSTGSHRVGHDWSNLAAAAATYEETIIVYWQQSFKSIYLGRKENDLIIDEDLRERIGFQVQGQVSKHRGEQKWSVWEAVCVLLIRTSELIPTIFFQAIINNLENKLGYDMSESTKIAMRNYSWKGWKRLLKRWKMTKWLSFRALLKSKI